MRERKGEQERERERERERDLNARIVALILHYNIIKHVGVIRWMMRDRAGNFFILED